MRISDWSADVCSSDLMDKLGRAGRDTHGLRAAGADRGALDGVAVAGAAAVIVRFIAVTLLGWMLGFAWFAIFLPQPLDGRQTDAIVVLTGGAGRIDRGLALLQDGAAKRMLISGRSEEHTSELQSLMRISYAVFCLKK